LGCPKCVPFAGSLFPAAERSGNLANELARDYSAGVDQKWLAMAFGMPGANLSRWSDWQNAAKNRQLDILASGMPKTFVK
jgi:hypothetical protein